MCQVSALHIHKKCGTPLEPITLTIEFGNDKVDLCNKCWSKICNTDLEWGNTPRPTMEQILSEETRVGKNPTLTEYKIRGIKKGKFSDSDELSDVERKELENEEEENE